MVSDVLPTKRDHALLVGDGFLLTAATSATALAVLLGLFVLAGSPDSNAFWALVNVILMLLGGVVGIIMTWRLHGFRVTRRAVIGGLVGAAMGGVFVPVIGLVAFLFGLVAGLFTSWEFAGLVAAALVFGGACVALSVWLLVDAAHDLALSRRNHVGIDRARIVASVVIVIFGTVVTFVAMRQPDSELAEAIVFALLAGVAGALAVAGADFSVLLAVRRQGKGAGDGLA